MHVAQGPSPTLDAELSDAAFVCDFARVRELLAQGANPNVHDEDMRTPLHQAVLGNSVGLMGLLIEAHADVNAKDNQGFTPLHFAAQEFLPEIARILVGKGADVNAQQGDGATALQMSLQNGLDAHPQFLEVYEPDILAPGTQSELATVASQLASAEH